MRPYASFPVACHLTRCRIDSEWTYVAPSPRSVSPFGGYLEQHADEEVCVECDVRRQAVRPLDDGPLVEPVWFGDGFAHPSRRRPGTLRHHHVTTNSWQSGGTVFDGATKWKTWTWAGRPVRMRVGGTRAPPSEVVEERTGGWAEDPATMEERSPSSFARKVERRGVAASEAALPGSRAMSLQQTTQQCALVETLVSALNDHATRTERDATRLQRAADAIAVARAAELLEEEANAPNNNNNNNNKLHPHDNNRYYEAPAPAWTPAEIRRFDRRVF